MIVFLLILLGLCLGSFVNALVWRLYEQQKAKSPKQKAKYSVSRGRSMCPNCKHALVWYDLVPVLSWVSLKGKCRYCHKPISWQYPIVELGTAMLFVFSYIFWPSILHSPLSILQFVLWLIMLVGFMSLIVYDVRWMLLPDRIVRPMQLLAAVYVVITVLDKNSVANLASAGWGVLLSAGLFFVIYQLSKGKWIGGGDVKLAVVLGLLLGGPAKIMLMIFIASALGSFMSIPLLLTHRLHARSRIPFGPLLIIATIIVYLFGAGWIAWYTNQFLIV